MVHFWPQRPSPKGFSIERLASKYRERLSKASSNVVEKRVRNETSSISIEDERKENINTNFYTNSTHWANRDFSEYKKAA